MKQTLLALTILIGQQAFGATIISTLGPGETGAQISSISIAAVGFHLSSPLAGGSIAVKTSVFDDAPATGEGWLMRVLGPTATANDIVAHGTFSIPNTSPQNPVASLITVFDALSLTDGDYYLVLTSDNGGSGWATTLSPANFLHPSASLIGSNFGASFANVNPNFNPASSFLNFGPTNSFQYQLTGESRDGAQTPEPGTLALLGLGLLLVGTRAKSRWSKL